MINRQSSNVSAAARVLLALLFVVSAFGKLAAPAATKAYIVSVGLPSPDLAYLAALFIELGLGMALLVGYRTRVVATLLAIFTVITAFVFHAQFADPNQMTHFLKNIAIAGGLLQVAVYGAGGLGLDALRLRRSQTA
ncbi:DoxX family protein [Pusillimonas sp. ANT_WB101]|uniref:DoxX family protein n=1 Tax=Pusillimonas sp. ANT_WB101 TaxID=2597356 RepID=UPI0011ECC8FA|nr:DoxX family protein [Pusillimonas sp. ANT_WB101]KAA0892539.1 DoxX family protein [Pusillimonas sp. ANT_WB101]